MVYACVLASCLPASCLPALTPSLFLFPCSEALRAGVLVFRNELASHFQGLTLLVFDTVLGFVGSSASLGVGHSKHVIGLNTAVGATVAWNGVSELKAGLALSLDSEEDLGCIFVGLGRGLSHDGVFLSSLEETVTVSFELLLGDNMVGFSQVATVELLDGARGDGLLQ